MLAHELGPTAVPLLKADDFAQGRDKVSIDPEKIEFGQCYLADGNLRQGARLGSILARAAGGARLDVIDVIENSAAH
jgi:hypothetical protein